MSDRELLELAAKAAGHIVRWHAESHYGPTMEIMEGDIKTWRERVGVSPEYSLDFATPVEKAMVDEIADLRAAVSRLTLKISKPRKKRAYQRVTPGEVAKMRRMHEVEGVPLKVIALDFPHVSQSHVWNIIKRKKRNEAEQPEAVPGAVRQNERGI